MLKKLIWNGIKFDDFEEEPSNYWSQICEDCIKKYNIPKKHLDTVGCGICGVEGCEHTEDEGYEKKVLYIDIPKKEAKIIYE